MPLLMAFSLCSFFFLVGSLIGHMMSSRREVSLGPLWRRIGRRAGYKTALEVMRENPFDEAQLIVKQLYEQTFREGLETKEDGTGHT